MPSPVASIVMCTRDRSASLAEALRALNCEASTATAEVIVVDNGSSDDTAAVVAAAAAESRFPLTLVREPAVGQCRARNAGVRAARGEYVLFLDDDVRVHRHWIDGLVAGFGPGVAMVAGRVRPVYPSGAPRWLTDGAAPALSLWDYGSAPFEMDHRTPPIGANMAVRADLLRDMDEPFSPQLGHTGALNIGHDEFHLARRLSGRISYVPQAVADHLVDARRSDYGYARRTYIQSGFGQARFDRLLGEPEPPLAGRLVRAAWMIVKATAIRAQNARQPSIAPFRARRELIAYYFVGLRLDQLLSGAPRISDWLARNLS